MSEYINQVLQFPAWRGEDVLSLADLDLSVIEKLTPLDSRSPEDVARMKDHGVTIAGGPTPATSRNIVLVDTTSRTNALTIWPPGNGKGENLCILYPGTTTCGKIHLGSGNNLLLAGPSLNPRAPQRMDANLIGPHTALVYGRRATTGSLTCAIEGPEHYIVLGADSMLSIDIMALATDYHSMIPLDTGELANPPGDIVIGRHVWVGMQVMIMKGARIGDGSIIGTRSLVSGSIPPMSLAVGSPAKVVRERISWSRRAPTLTAGLKWAQNAALEFDLAPTPTLVEAPSPAPAVTAAPAPAPAAA